MSSTWLRELCLSSIIHASFVSPIGFSLNVVRQTLPYVVKLGPAWFRRKLLGVVPSKLLHTARDIIDIMDATSREIYEKKKVALAQGDEAVVNQIGRGKDIMSLLRSLSAFKFSTKDANTLEQ